MLQHPCGLPCFGGYPLIAAGTSLPHLFPCFLCALHGCAEGTAWRLPPHLPPQPLQFFSQLTGLGGTSVPPPLPQEDVTVLKWSGNIRGAERSGKGVCYPQHWGSLPAAQPGVVRVGTTEGIVNWKVSPSLRHYDSVTTGVLFPSAWSSLPEGWVKGGA